MNKKTAFHTACSLFLTLLMLAGLLAGQSARALAGPMPPQAPSDFNHHACADLAIGVMGESKETAPAVAQHGALQILWGSNNYPAGLTASGNQLWHQGAPTSGTPITETMEAGDRFGTLLAAGDFDSDGFYDVVVGVPHEDRGALTDSGAVQVLYGSITGFSAGRNQYFDQASPSMAGAPEANDNFGFALAVGNFNGDGYPDLAIGAPGEAVLSAANEGFVHILFGSAAGLTTTGNQFFSQDSVDGTIVMPGVPEPEDRFGASLAAGDFNGDQFADLAIGVPGEDVSGVNAAGMVQILYGSAAGLKIAGNQTIHQGSATTGTPDEIEADDNFGAALAAGNFNGDAYTDLAIGVHMEDIDDDQNTGGVQIMFGRQAGLEPWSLFMQVAVCAGSHTNQTNGWFGVVLASGNFNGDRFTDLAIGATGYDVAGVANSGAVGIMYGTDGSLPGPGSFCMDQTSFPYTVNEPDDYMGGSLAAGDFNCDHKDDLAIGIANEDMSETVKDVGLVVEVPSGVHGLDPTRAKVWTQDPTNILDASEAGDMFGFALVSAPVIVPYSLYLPLTRK